VNINYVGTGATHVGAAFEKGEYVSSGPYNSEFQKVEKTAISEKKKAGEPERNADYLADPSNGVYTNV